MSPVTPFMKMFGQSPLRPVQKHMTVAYKAAASLAGFYQACHQGDWGAATAIQQEINDLEHEADKLKKEIRSHLPKSLFLPVPRGDLLAILSAQDKVANQAKDIAGLIIGRRIKIPANLQGVFSQLIERSITSCEQAKKAIDELDELLECAFRGSEIRIVEQMIDVLDDVEHETDDLQIELRQELFKIESEMPPIEVIFLYKTIESVGALADRAHDVGGKLQVLLAR